MSNPEARLVLANLIADRMAELTIEHREFMVAAGFTKSGALTRYLRGYSTLELSQVEDVARILDLDEAKLLLMYFAQKHDESCMAVLRRNFKRRRKRNM
jgi:cyanate lyase